MFGHRTNWAFLFPLHWCNFGEYYLKSPLLLEKSCLFLGYFESFKYLSSGLTRSLSVDIEQYQFSWYWTIRTWVNLRRTKTIEPVTVYFLVHSADNFLYGFQLLIACVFPRDWYKQGSVLCECRSLVYLGGSPSYFLQILPKLFNSIIARFKCARLIEHDMI